MEKRTTKIWRWKRNTFSAILGIISVSKFRPFNFLGDINRLPGISFSHLEPRLLDGALLGDGTSLLGVELVGDLKRNRNTEIGIQY